MKQLLLIFFLAFQFLNAQTFPERPSNYITDEAGVLSNEQIAELSADCKAFEDSTSNQIFVYITKSLKGQEMQPLCQEIFHKWQIGQKGKNNGVLIGVFVDDHKFRIHTGYGLEGALPDLLTKKIQDDDMKPLFKEGDYFQGIKNGIDKLVYFTANEFSEEDLKEDKGLSWTWVLVMLYIFNVVVLALLIASCKKSTKSEGTKTVVKVLAWMFALIPFLGAFGILVLFAVLGNVRKASEVDFSYSGTGDSSFSDSGSSDSSSSDFDGGGGGDSGGGGSDSSW